MGGIKIGDMVTATFAGDQDIGHVTDIYPGMPHTKDDFNIQVKWSDGSTLYYSEEEIPKMKSEYKKLAKEALSELNKHGTTNNRTTNDEEM